jgi:hypothetical protein
MSKKIKLAVLLFSACSIATAGTLETVSLTIWGEGRGISYSDKYDIASVIYNLSHGDPAKFKGTCLQRKIFSCWRHRKFAVPLPDLRKPIDRRSWTDCVTLASLMMGGKFKPSTKAKHYHTPDITPYWAKDYPILAMNDCHVFRK